MIQDCTHSPLIALLYNEVDAYDALDVLELLDADSALQEEYKGLEQAHRMLSQISLSPSTSATSAILRYSRS